MNRKESAKSWIFILLFMLSTAVIAAFWPTLMGSKGNFVPVPTETVYVEIPMLDEAVAAPMAMAAIAAVATVLIIVVGVGITIIFTLIAKFIHKEGESDSYVENTTALAAQEKEALAAQNNERTITGASDASLRKWPTWGTSILALFLVGSLSMMASRVLWPPTGDILVDGKVVSIGMKFVLYMLISTAVILAVFLKPSYVNNIDKTDHDSAPWVLYWVILMGLIVVGLNFGYMLYLGTL